MKGKKNQILMKKMRGKHGGPKMIFNFLKKKEMGREGATPEF